MREDTIKSFAKINLSLGVLGKYNKNFHRIETLVSFIDLISDSFSCSKSIDFNISKIDSAPIHAVKDS